MAHYFFFGLSQFADGQLWTAKWWTEDDTPGGSGEFFCYPTMRYL